MNADNAKKAAKWWADQLRGDAKLDNGDNSVGGAVTYVIATSLQKREKESITAEQINAFEVELTELLKSEGNIWGIGVDYHPDYILQQAADKAGLKLGMTTLPWKTYMSFHDGKVTVSCGYRASPVEI